ncbi:DNA ligase [Ottowia sp.]|uniref:DNA ligase n=1 Tax=Ottowia sp. TaxID=1898956 RepID=UPI003A879A44
MALLASTWAGHALPAPALLLAQSYRPGIDLRDWWVSEKYDGVRGHWDGQALRTRGGQRINAPTWFTANWPITPMDGELWAGRGRFDAAQSAAARQQPDDAAWRTLRYMVFDLPAHPGTFDERLGALHDAVARIGHPWVQAAPQRKVASDTQLQALLRQVVQDGGEGLMLHRGQSHYSAGRSDDLLKLKPFDDAEAQVTGHLPGKGKYAGMVGALQVQTPQGQRFALGSGLADALRRSPPAIGTWVTYRYRGLHAGSGLPRFASFVRVRPDFKPEDAAR